jgi:hypothetical protein
MRRNPFHRQFTYKSRLVPHRSRTSGSVLQTALWYLEAIHAKVPELVEKEKTGDGSIWV